MINQVLLVDNYYLCYNIFNMKNPTNGELAIMIGAIRDEIIEMKKSFKIVNRDIKKNTDFRNKTIGALVFVSVFFPMVVVIFIIYH